MDQCSFSTIHQTLQDYESLSESVHYRLSYDRGRLEVMSPQSEHRKLCRTGEQSRTHRLRRVGIGSGRLSDHALEEKEVDGGVEADVCFYVVNAYRVIGKRNIDLEYDPPPDIVVEIDITNRSSRKFPIYARLAVPEIWHYDGTTVRFYSLVAGSICECPVSCSLPAIQPAAIGAALEHSKTIARLRIEGIPEYSFATARFAHL